MSNKIIMKNLKKISKEEQKAIFGGMVPSCCITWNPRTRVCSSWDYSCLGQ